MKTSKYALNTPPELQEAVGWMFEYIKPGSLFLDFGCSTGYFGRLIKEKRNCTVDGVEISVDVKEARKVLDTVYSFDLDGDWPKEIYAKNYDYVFFGDVLEHLKDPAQALQKVNKILKKDGRIFISIPNVAHLSVRLELLTGHFEYEPMGILDNTHLKYFTRQSFAEMASDGGFVIESYDYTQNEYPKEVVQKYLDKVGLRADQKFWQITKEIEATAFQYKFILKRATARTNNKLPPAPQKPEQYKSDYISDLKSQMQALRDHAQKQAEIIAHQEQEIARLEVGGRKLRRKLVSKLKRR